LLGPLHCATVDGLRLRLGWVGPLAPPPYGRSLGRLAIRKWGVGPDWVLDPRAGLVLAGTHLGGLSGVMGGYQQD
jgi:hypothetical protein